ncbi:hypothetical protein KKE26_03535, partial [bacterium]|nr:hypothetical protein [bacterium]
RLTRQIVLQQIVETEGRHGALPLRVIIVNLSFHTVCSRGALLLWSLIGGIDRGRLCPYIINYATINS